MKNFDSYQKWALTKWRTDENPAVDQTCAGLGVAGEAGEVADLLKKHHGHKLPLDRGKLTKELGDVLFYVAIIAHQHGIPLGRVAAENVAKLEARYPDGFSPEAAAARADELPPTVRTRNTPKFEALVENVGDLSVSVLASCRPPRVRQ